MINTYNETSLHKTLKQIYAAQSGGIQEQKIGPYICDIAVRNTEIIEIQTARVSALREKIQFCLEHNLKITVVHPVVEEKIILTYGENGNLISTRKSPKRETIYKLPRELSGIYNFLTGENFTLEVIFISVTEIRLKTAEKLQNRTNTRRHLKNYIITEKKLNFMRGKQIFKTKKDYKNLIPTMLPEFWTPPMLKDAVFNSEDFKNLAKSTKNSAAAQYKILIWLLEKMEIIKKSGKQGRSWLYTVV